MRSTDEQLREIMGRAEVVRENRSIRKRVIRSAWACAVCAVLLAVVCAYVPRLSAARETARLQRYGSLLLEAPYMGFVVIGLVAFLLGVCVTLLCFYWKRMKDKERRRR